MVMESYAYRIYLFGATMLLKLVTGACATGEREPKGPETREKEESNYGAVVGEEIFVCSPDVTDAMHYETRTKPSGVSEYGIDPGGKTETISWFGSKGFDVRREWWDAITVLLEDSRRAST